MLFHSILSTPFVRHMGQGPENVYFDIQSRRGVSLYRYRKVSRITRSTAARSQDSSSMPRNLCSKHWVGLSGVVGSIVPSLILPPTKYCTLSRIVSRTCQLISTTAVSLKSILREC